MNRNQLAKTIRARLDLERGRIDKQAPFTIALAYPSGYRVAMSSLGMLQIYRVIQQADGMACERVMLPDDAGSGALDSPPLTLESLRPLSAFPVVAFSVAYELEMAGMVQMLEGAGIAAQRADRSDHDPFILAGGPLTFSNPLPLGVFADAIVMGEADELVLDVLGRLRDNWHPGEPGARRRALEALAELDHVFVPMVHGSELPSLAQCADTELPAHAPIRTPDTELSDMFLLEAERGCSRGCTYCVMRRSTNGGMRIVDPERIFELIPEGANRVGLVGAAVSDHPQIVHIVNSLVERKIEVGLSSLRPDKLDDAFVGALKAGGYRTLTTAMDGASDRMREVLDRRARTKHLVRAAELTKAHGIHRLKLYLMLGVPTETNADIDECAAFVTELSRIVPVSLAVAPFCAKRNTPLDGQPFAGIKLVSSRIERLRNGLKGKAEVRATSSRWAWVEHALAQGGEPEGEALLHAVHAGGRFAHYKRALADRQTVTTRRKLFIVRSTPELSARRTDRWLEPLVVDS